MGPHATNLAVSFAHEKPTEEQNHKKKLDLQLVITKKRAVGFKSLIMQLYMTAIIATRRGNILRAVTLTGGITQGMLPDITTSG